MVHLVTTVQIPPWQLFTFYMYWSTRPYDGKWPELFWHALGNLLYFFNRSSEIQQSTHLTYCYSMHYYSLSSYRASPKECPMKQLFLFKYENKNNWNKYEHYHVERSFMCLRIFSCEFRNFHYKIIEDLPRHVKNTSGPFPP